MRLISGEFAAVLLALVYTNTAACGAKPHSPVHAQFLPGQAMQTAAPSKAPTPAGKPDPEINLGCLQSRLENPPDSYSYYFAKDTSNDIHVSQEADITPQTMDGRFRAEGNEHAFSLHGVHSNPQNWAAAVSHLTAASDLSGIVGVLLHSSAIKREGDMQKINGYDVIPYSIDTTRWSAAERQRLQSSLGLGAKGTEKGSVWVTADGCPVKLVLDTESFGNDGEVIESIHYEESLIKN